MLSGASFTFGLVRAVASEIPTLDPNYERRLDRNSYLLAADGESVLAVLRGSESRVLVEPHEISDAMKKAIVAIEDRRFFEHRGVDLRSIGRAFVADVRNQRVVQGGSTITQQFVKNAYVDNQRSIARKLKEAALAWQIEQRWSKDRILTAYLNTIYFGNGAYGVQQAARTYFHHGASRLTLAESALLAGIPSDPSRYDPVTRPLAARARRAFVLRQLLEQRRVTADEYVRARRVPLPRPQNVSLPGTQGPAQYFVNYAKQQLVADRGPAEVFGGGLKVRTTIDLALQKRARDAIAKWLEDDDGPSAALVAIRPADGAVVAMVGGKNYRESQFNLAVQGQRQPGSAFKPFVLAEALRQGISPATRLRSEPTEIWLGDRFWTVRNYEDAYLGLADLRTATIQSDNAVYARLTQLVRPANVRRMARALGITTQLEDNLGIGLGTEAVSPLELARAYATLANGGRRIDGLIEGPRVIEAVEHTDGSVDENLPDAVRVLSEDNAVLVTSILEGVVRQGSGMRAALPDGRPVAGKTGTTEAYGDAWFVGYTPQLVAAVWVGYPDGLRPMLTEFHGEPVAGGTYPALIWKSFMERALPKIEAAPQAFPAARQPYALPRSVILRGDELRLDNGICREPTTVFYFVDEGPTTEADCRPNEVEVPNVSGSPIADARARLSAQPLTPAIVYRPARPAQRLGVVLRQYPSRGWLTSYDRVTLVLARATQGVVPRVVGLRVRAARARLALAGLRARPNRLAGRVVEQTPPAGVAAARGMRVALSVTPAPQ